MKRLFRKMAAVITGKELKANEIGPVIRNNIIVVVVGFLCYFCFLIFTHLILVFVLFDIFFFSILINLVKFNKYKQA